MWDILEAQLAARAVIAGFFRFPALHHVSLIPHFYLFISIVLNPLHVTAHLWYHGLVDKCLKKS